MKQDAYWQVLDRINRAKDSDVSSFADALEQFGILELSMIGIHAKQRRAFLNGEASSGLRPNVRAMSSMSGTSGSWSLWPATTVWATMIWATASTAAWAL